jgi:2-alkyl-3-oxoalkanoate reductase
MEIFLTGATRVLGHTVVQRLVAAGHRVRAFSRSEENAVALRQLGTDPVPASLFEVESLKPALTGSDATLHLAASIPPTMKMGAMSCSARKV